jgi:hypothetical protein
LHVAGADGGLALSGARRGIGLRAILTASIASTIIFTAGAPAHAAWTHTSQLHRASMVLSGGAAAPGRRSRAHAPIIARHPRAPYHGPIYELNPEGAVVPYLPPALASEVAASSGGSAPKIASAGIEGAPEGGPTPRPKLLVPGKLAVMVGHLAAAPMDAPEAVKRMIWGANEIVGLPYIYGGGHGSFRSPGYDCSGTVSYALHGGGMLHSPEDSSELELYGRKGVGTWVTIFANAGHAYMDIAGLRLDTSPVEDPSDLPGPEWRPIRSTNAEFVIRHPVGL